METVVNEGFALDPDAFAPLANWNTILLQAHMADHYLKRLQTHKTRLGDLADSFEQNAFFTAFLTTYAKCFVSAEGKAVKLDSNEMFKMHPSVRIVHDRIMDLRHSYAAHSGESGLIRTTMAVKEESDSFIVRHLVTSAFPGNELAAFSQAVTALDEFVTLRLNQRLDKLQARLGKPIFPE
jgi:hypothetical protein